MSLQFSYKQTEIGRIPKEWEVARLGDISNQRNEIVQPEQKRNDKFVGLEHVEKGETKIKAYGLASGVISSKFRFFPGDILYGKLRPYLDKAVIADFAGICSTDLVVIDQDKKKVYPNFLIYIMHSPNFISHAISTTSGTNHPRTSWNAIAKFKLGLPPLSEQKKIAEILSTVDQGIEKIDEAIRRTQRLKNGLMQELLTKGIGHKEFKETEIGRIPKEWELVKLSNVFKLASGKSRPKEISAIHTQKMAVPVYGGNGILGYTNRFMIDNETIVIGRVGEYCGSIHKTQKSSWVTDNALYALAIEKHKVNLDFLTYYLAFINLNKFKKESGQPLMTQTIVYSISCPLPPLPEQQKIAEILSTADERLELLRKRKERLERTKKGLMDVLLTGRKRVRLEV